MYVTRYANHSVAVITEASHAVTSTFNTVQEPDEIAVDAGTDTAYVGSLLDPTVSVIKLNPHRVTASVRVRTPIGIAVDPNTHTVFVANARRWRRRWWR